MRAIENMKLWIPLALAVLAAGCDSGRPPLPSVDQPPAAGQQTDAQARAASLAMERDAAVATLGGILELVVVVKDEQGRALPDTRVDWLLKGGEAVSASFLNGEGDAAGDHGSGVTDAQGRVVQKLSADKPGHVRVYAVLQTGAGRAPLLAPALASWINARVDTPAVVEAKGGQVATVSTRVLRGDGKPLAGYRVHWSLDDPAAARFRGSDAHQATSLTDAQGIARIQLQAAGPETRSASVGVSLEPPEREACQCSQLPSTRLAAGLARLVWQAAEAKTEVPKPQPPKLQPTMARAPAKPNLQLAMTCPQAVELGERVEYELTLTNHGPGQARDVLVQDRLPPGLKHDSGDAVLDWRVAKLPPGQTVTARVWTRAVATGEQLNTARITDYAGEASCAIRVRQAALGLAKQGPAERYLGQTAGYQIQVRNTGDGIARQVVVGDAYPQGMRFVSANPPGKHDEERRQVTWSLGDMPAGEARDLQVAFKSDRLGRLCNQSQALAEGGLDARDGACTEVKGLVALLLEVVDGPDPVVIGTQTAYRIEVLNQGSAPATHVTVHATLPEQLTFQEAGGPSQAVVEGRDIRFAPLATLAPGEKAVYRVKVKALKEGDVRFATEITAHELSAPVRETESTRLYE